MTSAESGKLIRPPFFSISATTSLWIAISLALIQLFSNGFGPNGKLIAGVAFPLWIANLIFGWVKFGRKHALGLLLTLPLAVCRIGRL